MHTIKFQITSTKLQKNSNYQYSMTEPMMSNTFNGLLDKSIDKHIQGLICLDREDRLKITP
jgi:hypothetical protein